MFKRNLIHALRQWKSNRKHKPLLLRGARQVGKTHLIREFGREFDQYIELNLELEADKLLFELETVEEIATKLFLNRGVELLEGQSLLLFIDEIQEEPKAIGQLRYFYEKLPHLHVIAAGSLLEFALGDVKSMPVGRTDFIYLHPLNFDEFLQARGNVPAYKAFHEIPLKPLAQDTLFKLFHEYVMLGGMPEILADFFQNGDFTQLSKSYRKLWEVYQADVPKYARNATEKKVISHVMDTAHTELQRIKFEGFGNSNYKSREVGEAIRALDKSSIIRLLYASTSTDLPIQKDVKKRPKLQFLDTGMLIHSLQTRGELVGIEDLNKVYEGHIIEHMIYQELISLFSDIKFQPNFWVREKKDANSEVDVVLQFSKYAIPIEVKSGKQGALRSLHQFVNESNHPYAVRMYAGPLAVEKHTTNEGTEYLLLNLPYFLGNKIFEYLDWFTTNHKL